MPRKPCYTLPSILLALALSTGAYAQVSSINSAAISPRVFNDVPGATLATVSNYPTTISFSESGVSAASGFANKDLWQFSANGGTSAYQFAANDYFYAAFDLTMTASAVSPRKEAGFYVNSANVGEIFFIVDSDGHEVVQFGGSSFYSFNSSQGLTYTDGQTIRLGISYFRDGNGNNALELSANNLVSPWLEFTAATGNGSLDMGNGTTVGAYFQIQNDASNAGNSGAVSFSNITIQSIPEPSVLALLGLGCLPLLFRRRK